MSKAAVPLMLKAPIRRAQTSASKIFDIRCEDNISFMKRITSDSIDLIVTSPPYNVGKEYEKCESLETYLKGQEALLDECVRTLSNSGSLCWQVGTYVENGEIFPLDMFYYFLLKQRGLKLRNRIVWHYEHGLHCTKRLSGRYETLLWFTKTDIYKFNVDPIRVPSKYPNKRHYKGPRAGELSCNPLGKNPGDVWSIPNVKANHLEKTAHPCQFPVELVERLVLALTDTGDRVLDPYLGAGSSVIAALLHDRLGIGCDIESRYVDIALERVKRLKEGSLRTRPMNKPIHNPFLLAGRRDTEWLKN